MLMSTESDSEADDTDATVLRRLNELEAALSTAWQLNKDRYNADLVSSVTPGNGRRVPTQ
jgi:hypothetical protein